MGWSGAVLRGGSGCSGPFTGEKPVQPTGGVRVMVPVPASELAPQAAPTARELRILEARRLRRQGLSYPRVGERLGVSGATVFRWLNQGAEERHYAQRRAWKRDNPERVAMHKRRARAKAGPERRRTVCPGCAGPMYPGSAMCRPCTMKATTERRVALWATGASRRQVAAEVGMSIGALSEQMATMRAAGWDLPRRKPAGVRRERREQKAAA